MAGPIDPLDQTKAESIVPGKMNAGSQIGGYDLIEVLGEGGMGVVWRAHDPKLDREIAIKVLKRHDAHPSLRKRLLREGRAMARLKHPNVLTVYEVDTAGNRDYIAMELVEGGSLDAWIAMSPPREDVIKALLAAGRGLAAAHAAGLVHRDFKPHNVLRSQEGRILVTDFGLARGLGEDSSSGITEPPTEPSAPATAGLDETLDAVKSTPTSANGSGHVRTDSVLDSPITQTGALIGTPAYMAPEQFRGAAPDPRTDQFAFCVTAWQALTGSRPHTGSTLDELRRSAERGIGNLPSTLAPAIRAVLARGLDPDPAKRWPDLDALLDALEHVERPRRPRWIIPAGAFGVVALVGITALMTRRSGDVPVVKAGCDPADTAFQEAWSDKVRDQLWTTAQSAEVGADVFARATDPFAEFRKRWISSYAEACTTKPDAKTQARVGCLLDARDQVSAIALALQKAPAMVYERFDAHGILPNIAVCNGPKPVASPPIPPDKRTRVIAVIAGAFATVASPRLAEALDRLDKEAIDIGWEPLRPKVFYAGGAAYLKRHELANAREMFNRAVELAGPVRDVRTAAHARLGLLEASMIELVKPNAKRKPGELHPELISLLTYARKAVEVAGDDPMLAGAVSSLEASAYAALGRWSFGKREYKTAIMLIQEARQHWNAAGDVQRAAIASEIEAQLYLRRADERALDDALFALRGAEESLERAKLPRLDMLTELRAGVALARGNYSDASALYRTLPHEPAASTAPKRTGIVLDTSGKPVAGATVVAWRGDLHGDPIAVVTDVRETLEEVTTTTDGTFEIHADPDTSVIAQFGRSRSTPRLAGTGEISLSFQPTREITGRVDSSNLAGVFAFARIAVGESAWIVRVPIAADHTYSLGGVPRGIVMMGTEGPAGEGWRIVRGGTNPTELPWPVGRAIEVIVRGRIDGHAATVWVFRDPSFGAAAAMGTPPKGRTLPATRAEAEALAKRASDIATSTLEPIGMDATDTGLELYERGDHHAVVPGSPGGGATLACVAPAAESTTPVTCADVEVITGAVFEHSNGRLGTDTAPVVIQLH